MILCVMIPAFNEEEDLPRVLADIPRVIQGIDLVKVLVINDGSDDHTGECASHFGADTVVNFTCNRGLAAAFETGLTTALALGADIVVNLDADYQYLPSEIPLLIEPIIRGRADMVIGDRQTDSIKEFSWLKRHFQRLGSNVVRRLARIETPIDAVSGFRAFNRQAALELNVITGFSYTTETIIQARQKGLAVASVPVTRNHTERHSRLFNSMWEHMRRTGATIARVYLMYQPLKVLTILSAIFGGLGFALLLRLAIIAISSGGIQGHMQSLTVGLGLCGMAFLMLVLGILADLIAINRRLLEDTLVRVKRMEIEHSENNGQNVHEASFAKSDFSTEQTDPLTLSGFPDIGRSTES